MTDDKLTAEDFNAWRRDPRTEAFFEYLADIRRELMDAWADGAPLSEKVQGRVQELGNIIYTTHADISMYYGDDTDDE